MALSQISGWGLSGDGDNIAIEKTFEFAEHTHALLFVNSVGWLSEKLNHHPELVLTYKRCVVRWSTHDVRGLSRLDFEAATQTDALLAAHDLEPGLVVATYGRHCLVETPEGRRLICHPRGKKNQVVVGDQVLWQIAGDEGSIEKLQDRRNLFYRQDEIRTKSFAANLDRVLILIAADPEYSESQLSRALVAAEAERITPIIALNKSDLAQPFAQAWERLAPYRAMGYSVMPISLSPRSPVADDGVAALCKHLQGLTTLVLGPSGSGKSTLINRLVPDALVETGEISLALNSGKHTTTSTRWYWVPALDGSAEDGAARTALIDSPGFQEFGLHHIEPTRLADCMPDLRQHLGGCKFYNCTHLHEPGCAVLAQVETAEHPGTISVSSVPRGKKKSRTASAGRARKAVVAVPEPTMGRAKGPRGTRIRARSADRAEHRQPVVSPPQQRHVHQNQHHPVRHTTPLGHRTPSAGAVAATPSNTQFMADLSNTVLTATKNMELVSNKLKDVIETLSTSMDMNFSMQRELQSASLLNASLMNTSRGGWDRADTTPAPSAQRSGGHRAAQATPASSSAQRYRDLSASPLNFGGDDDNGARRSAEFGGNGRPKEGMEAAMDPATDPQLALMVKD
eukprot:gene13110-15112_t